MLWEKVAPDAPDAVNWSWTDERLGDLRALGVRPIAGLVHHGGGPRYTDLLDPGFALGLARFAGQAAERYPWVSDWTPVNEPVTTARFSALYGHWHPHERSERAFWNALLNQIDGIRLSMRAIREVNPRARLIQTDDLGRTWATVPLRHQAAFDNSRRWMSWDLLCGMVLPEHALWDRLARLGFADRLRVIADDPCPPDVIGINHYLTSDRFLDHRLRRYPPDAAGGNNEQRYADVAAVRVLDPPPAGLRGALQDAWSRYGIPLAATEVHNGCTREEQMRWMAEAWTIALDLRDEGVAIEAVTSWSLLGSDGWDTLLTAAGTYEAGAFDMSGGTPRATAVAKMLPQLAGAVGGDCARPDGAAGGNPSRSPHPTLAGAGWWRRPIRLLHGSVHRRASIQDRAPSSSSAKPAPLLICGATGTLGQALARSCRHRDLAYVLTARAELDVNDKASIERVLERHQPWAVINATGWVRVDDAEGEPQACLSANFNGAELLARTTAAVGIPTVSFSSDLVFDGCKGAAYDEADSPQPVNVYGTSKMLAERAIAALPGNHLVIRTAAFFSPHDRHNFAMHLYDALSHERSFCVAPGQVVSPTYVPHLCNAVLDLLIDGETGVWHLTNGGGLSWIEFAHRIALRCGLDARLIGAETTGRTKAARPTNSALVSRRGQLLPSLDQAIDEFAQSLSTLTRTPGRSDLQSRILELPPLNPNPV